MALNVIVGDIATPGSTGNFDITLASGFDPKAIILVATPNAVDGVVAHASFGRGLGTYRGGTVQQFGSWAFSEDNVGTADTYSGQNIDCLIRLLDGAGAVDFEVALVSMTTGAGSKVTLNAVNLHTTANIRLQYMILGGSDLEDAEAHRFQLTTGAGAFDVALGSGFGHPDVVLFQRIVQATTNSTSGGDLSMGFGVLAGDDRSISWGSDDNATTQATFQRVDNDSALVAINDTGTIETDLILAAEAGFPTDGYEVTKATSSFASESTMALALKFSSNVTITSGGGSARTTTGDTDLAVGTSTPKGLMLLHTRQTTAGSTDTTSSDAALMGHGMVDGSGNERWAGVWDDDGQASASVASSAQSDDKAIRFYVPSTDALDAEADCTVSGSNFRLTWGDAAPSAFLYQWLAFGEVSATTVTATTGAATATGVTGEGKPTHTATTGAATATGVTGEGKPTHTATTGAATAAGVEANGRVVHIATTATATAAGVEATFSEQTTVVATTATATASGIEAQGVVVHTSTQGGVETQFPDDGDTPALIQEKTANAGAAGSSLVVTLDSGTTAGSGLVVAVAVGSSSVVISSVTGGSGTWTRRLENNDDGSVDREIWTCNNASAGTTAITLNYSASSPSGGVTAHVSEWSNVAAFDVVSEFASGTTSTTLRSGSTTQTYTKAVYLGFFSWRGSSSATVSLHSDRGWTALSNLTAPSGPASPVSGRIAYKVATHGPQQAQWSASTALAQRGIIIAMRATNSVATPLLWYSSFEESDLAEVYADDFSGGSTFQGGSVEISGTGSVDVSTDQARLGSQSAEVSITTSGSASGARIFRWEELRSNREIYLSAWYYIPEVPDFNGADGEWWIVKQIKSTQESSGFNEPTWAMEFLPSDVLGGSPGGLRMRYGWHARAYTILGLEGPHSGETGGVNYNPGVDIPIGEWFHVEWHLKQSKDFDGFLRIRIDGELVAEQTSVRTGAVHTAYNAWQVDQGWAVTNYSDGLDPDPFAIYVDEMAIATSTANFDSGAVSAEGVDAAGSVVHTATTATATATGISATFTGDGGTTVEATTAAATALGIDGAGRVVHTATTAAATALGIDGAGRVVHTATTAAATALGIDASPLTVHVATTGTGIAAGIGGDGVVVHLATTGTATAQGIEATFSSGGGEVTSPKLGHPLLVVGPTRESEVIGVTRTTDVIGVVRATDVLYDTRNTETVGDTRVSDVIGIVRNTETVYPTRSTDTIGTTRTTTTEEV